MDFITIFLICCVGVQALSIWIAAKISEQKRDQCFRLVTAANVTAILVFLPPLYELRIKVLSYLLFNPLAAIAICLGIQAAVLFITSLFKPAMRKIVVKGCLAVNCLFIVFFIPLYLLF